MKQNQNKDFLGMKHTGTVVTGLTSNSLQSLEFCSNTSIGRDAEGLQQ